jgi:hypothetical protein
MIDLKLSGHVHLLANVSFPLKLYNAETQTSVPNLCQAETSPADFSVISCFYGD